MMTPTPGRWVSTSRPDAVRRRDVWAVVLLSCLLQMFRRLIFLYHLVSTSSARLLDVDKFKCWSTIIYQKNVIKQLFRISSRSIVIIDTSTRSWFSRNVWCWNPMQMPWQNSRTFDWAMFNSYVTVIPRGYVTNHTGSITLCSNKMMGEILGK